jgi:hypothetical protein
VRWRDGEGRKLAWRFTDEREARELDAKMADLVVLQLPPHRRPANSLSVDVAATKHGSRESHPFRLIVSTRLQTPNDVGLRTDGDCPELCVFDVI